MKICIISNGDAFDKNNWSATPYNLSARFEKYDGVDVISLNLKELLPHKFYTLIRKTVGKILFIKGSPRDPLLFKKDSCIIQRKLEEYNADVYLFCAEYCASNNVLNGKKALFYNYVDATLRPLQEADPRHKLGLKAFLKKYEDNERICYSNMTACFTMNEWCKDSIANLYGYPRNKIYNVGFGINTTYLRTCKDYSDPHILIVLRKGTEYYKGLELLLEAFMYVRQERPDAHLSVVGTEYKKVEGVTYYYNKPRELTVELFEKAALYVMPAVREPNGITYLEALANKTPIVGLNRFSIPEFAGNGEYGFIVNKYDANELAKVIVEALRDTERLKKMGEMGQKYVEAKYNWNIVAKKMINIFQSDIAKVNSEEDR